MTEELNNQVRKHLKKSEITRRKIIRKAYDLFNKYGFAETTVATISKEAGVSYGTVYTYFNSKSDIFIEIMEEEIRVLYVMARTSFLPKTAQEAYKIICGQSLDYLKFAVDHKRMLEIIKEAMYLSPEVREKWQNISNYFLGTITQDIQYSNNAGLLRKDVIPEISARKWYADNECFLWEVLEKQEEYDLEKLSKILSREYVLSIYNVNGYEELI